MLALLTLLACNPDGAETTSSAAATTDATPTDTFPSFLGAPPRNLIMISIDTFRRDHMARYGSDLGLLPFLDELAADGVAMDDHVSCSNWTYPSITCVMNGRDNIDAGFIPQFDRTPLPEGVKLPAYLSDAGFYSVAISSNGWFSSETNMMEFYDHGDTPGVGLALLVYQKALEKLERAMLSGVDRWFLHIHLTEPHVPYRPPDPYLDELAALEPLDVDLGQAETHYDATGAWNNLSDAERELLLEHLQVRYRGEMRYLDDQLQLIFSNLAINGLLDDALVVFWTDHGEQFWEHGYQTHAYGLHREENDAIAIFWADNIVPAAWSGPTHHSDVVPTILDIFGLPIPAEVNGKVIGTADDDRARYTMSVARLGVVQAVIQSGRKLYYQWWSGDKELYDLESDPQETTNLYDPDDPAAVALWEELTPQMEALDALLPSHTPLDPGP